MVVRGFILGYFVVGSRIGTVIFGIVIIIFVWLSCSIRTWLI